MYFGEFSDEFESETKLIPPLGLFCLVLYGIRYLLQVQGQVSGIFSAKNSDTRLWNVDNSIILNVGGSLFRKLNRDDE